MKTKNTAVEIRIEKATAEHAGLLALLGAETFFESYSHLTSEKAMQLYLQQAFTTGQMTLEVESAASDFLIAWLDGEAVGYAKLRRDKLRPELAGQKVIELQRLYLKGRVKGSGIGRLLMMRCCEIAKQEKCEAIWLTVWKKNPDAVAFYEKQGFEIFGVTGFPMEGEEPANDTDWLMKKVLNC